MTSCPIGTRRRPPVSDGTPLGALLIDEGLLTDAQLDAALAEQARSGKPLGRLLIEPGTISEAELVRTLARQVGLEFVDLSDRAIDGSVASLVTESLARRYQAIPIGWEDGQLVVAMADPSNVFAVDDIRAIAGAEVRTVVATATQINETIERFYRMDSDVDAVVQAATEDADDEVDLANVVGGRRGRADRQVRQPARDPGGRTTARPTSTSSPPSTTCASGSASTACCTK